MDTLILLFQALWDNDYQTLLDPKLLFLLYGMLFFILFLENGVLPAAFLPGDSLLFLTGVLVAKGAMSFSVIVIILTFGASLGTWLGHMQGLWLSDTRLVKRWMSNLPEHYHKRAHALFHRHGLAALFIGRFIGFVRTLLPIMAGISGLKGKRFHIFNWLSAFLWILFVVSLGYLLAQTPVFQSYEDQIMSLLMMIPLALLVLGLITSVYIVWRNKRATKGNSNSD